MRGRLTQFTAVFLALLIFGLPIRARGWKATRHRVSHTAPHRSIRQLFIDVNSDAKPEKIDVLAHGLSRTIRIELEKHQDHARLSSDNRRWVLVPYDIDHDSDLDLIWAVRGDRKSAVVYINDGHANFRIQENTSRYASELNALIGDDDTDEQQPLKLKRKDKRARASSSSGIVFTSIPGSELTETQAAAIPDISTFTRESEFLNYPRKRGPPGGRS